MRSVTTARSAAARWPARDHPAVALDPDVAVGVDEHLVDRLVVEQGVECAEAVEPGDRGAHEPLAVGRAGERGDASHVGPHDVVGGAVVVGRGPTQLADEAVVDRRRRRAAPRSSRR